MFFIIKRNKGFTLIELLVVIAIIGILTSVVLASVNSARIKSRDARRAADMHEIFTALNMYFLDYGYLPITSAYGEYDSGGWDYSSQKEFMTFLKTAGYMANIPIDPINDMTGDWTVGKYAYRYYCYPSDTKGLHLGYKSEMTGLEVIMGNTGTGWTDTSFECK